MEEEKFTFEKYSSDSSEDEGQYNKNAFLRSIGQKPNAKPGEMVSLEEVKIMLPKETPGFDFQPSFKGKKGLSQKDVEKLEQLEIRQAIKASRQIQREKRKREKEQADKNVTPWGDSESEEEQ